MSSIVKFNKDSHIQRIQASYVDDKIKLSEFEEQMLERMKFVFSLRLKNKYSKQQAVSKLESEYKVSRATAYRDYRSEERRVGKECRARWPRDQLNENVSKVEREDY